MISKKKYNSPKEYISDQPENRQEALLKLEKVLQENLPEGIAEVIQYGMIGFVIPHSIYPEGYHTNPSDPLPFVGLANQKNHVALYHMGIYSDKKLLEWFEKSYAELNIGKLDMGKSCIRFKNTNKIPFELIAELSRKMALDDFIKMYDDYKESRKKASRK